MTKTISDHLSARRHERIRRRAATAAAVAMSILIGCIVAAAVVKTARIVAADQERCGEASASAAVCAGPAW